MLFNLDGKQITRMPHGGQFSLWRSRLSDKDYRAVVDAINEYVEGKDVFISSFIPGSDWSGTPYQPLWVATSYNEEHAAYFFGLMVWHVMMDVRTDRWHFTPADKDFDDVLGMRYFRPGGDGDE